MVTVVFHSVGSEISDIDERSMCPFVVDGDGVELTLVSRHEGVTRLCCVGA